MPADAQLTFRMSQQFGRSGGVERGGLLQIFPRKFDLPGLKSFVETNLSQLHLFDTEEHNGTCDAGQNS